MKRTKYVKLAEKLEGRWTLDSLAYELDIDRKKAIYIIHRLRKLGYVKTYYGRNNMRVYYIGIKYQSNGESYTEKINSISPIKLAEWEPYYVYGKEIRYEDALIYALKKRDVRYTIASISLFRQIGDWSYLYKIAKKEDLVREIVALYEVARMFLKKLKKIPKRFYNLARKNIGSYHYIVDKSSSDNFNEIEK